MIDSKSLIYTEFKDPRNGKITDFEEGSSGPLLLGRDKKSGKRYIIKHTYAHNAANEFVCCSLAEKLGIAAPRAYLLTPSERFSSKYAVAIEFLDGMKEVNKDNLTAQMKKDICCAYAFQYAFAQSDLVAIREWNNRVVTFDFSEAFNMDDMGFLLMILEKAPEAAPEFLGRYLSGFQNSITTNLDYADVFEKDLNIDPDFTHDAINGLWKQLVEIPDSDIYAICDELDLMYPVEIGLYYEAAIRAVIDYCLNT